MPNENLNPENTPDHFQKVDESGSIRRLTKNPIVIISGVLIIALIGLLIAAASRSDSGVKGNEPSDKSNEIVTKDDAMGSGASKMLNELSKKEGAPGTETLGDPLGDPFAAHDANAPLGQDPLNPAQPSTSNGSSVPPAPLGQSQALGQPPKMNFIQEAQQQRLEQRLKYSMKALDEPSKTGLSTMAEKNKLEGSIQSGQNAPTPNLMDKYMSQLGALAPQTAQASNASDKNRGFINEAISYDYLAAQKAPQQRPFEIKTGTVVPGVMITGINSDLPGKVKAQVSENVYDTATGRYMLIPQGTTLIGDYSSNVIYGQERVLIAWNRLVFPDGHVLNIGNMNGIDKGGYAGFTDQVNNHYWRIFTAAGLMSAITGGIAASSNSNSTVPGQQTTSDAMVAAAIQQFGAVGTKMVEKGLDIAPTLEIRPGYKFSIFITKDLKLDPLKLKLR